MTTSSTARPMLLTVLRQCAIGDTPNDVLLLYGINKRNYL